MNKMDMILYVTAKLKEAERNKDRYKIAFYCSLLHRLMVETTEDIFPYERVCRTA